MFVGAKQILAGALMIGGFFTYILFMGFLIAPIMQIVQIARRSQKRWLDWNVRTKSTSTANRIK